MGILHNLKLQRRKVMGFIAVALGAITPFFIIKACRATVKDEADLFTVLSCISTAGCLFYAYQVI